jgi:MFS family permease
MRKYLLKVFLDHFAFGLTIPIVVIWQLSRGGNLIQVSAVVAIMTVVTLLADIPTGVFADRYGRKISLALGSLVLGLSFFVLAVSRSFWMFCAYSILSGLGWALLSGAEEAYVFETSKNEDKVYRLSISDVTIVDEVATIAGLLCATLFTKFFGLQNTITVAGIVLVLTAVISIYILLEPPKHLSQIGKSEEKITNGAIVFLKKHSQYFIIMIIFAVYYEGGRLLWQPQLVNNGVKIYQLGLIYGLFKVFAVGGSVLAKKRALDDFKWPLIMAGIVLASTFIMIASNVLGIVLIGFCVYSFIENYTRVLQSDYMNKVIDSSRATFLSLNNIVRNGYSAALAPFLGVIALSRTYRGFVVLAVAQVIAVIALVSIMTRKKILS